MRKTLVLAFLVVMTVLAINGCNDSPTGGTSGLANPGVERTRDYFVFDTTKTYLVRQIDVDRPFDFSSGRGEAMLGWEQTLGEPYTDVNGNGVFDPGIDVYIISLRPDNQDLNRNSVYDGPSDRCSNSVPFDDIDGDGNCVSWNGLRQGNGRTYQAGVPFEDINGNGVYDADLGYSYRIHKIGQFLSNVNSREAVFQKFDDPRPSFKFTSDSGYTYDSYGNSPNGIKGLGSEPFFLTDSSLTFYSLGAFLFNTTRLHNLDIRNLREVDSLMTFLFDTDTVGLVIEFGKSITFFDESYVNLLHIQFSKYHHAFGSSDEIERVVVVTDYYFDKQEGLRAIRREFLEGGYTFKVVTEWSRPVPTPLTQ